MKKEKILLKGGTLVSSEGSFQKDLLIENGKISGGRSDGAEVIDCRGKVILPGLIDVHVHFREPGASYKEDWTTGSSAAVAGGVTTVCDMPNNKPAIVSVDELEKKRALIKGRSYCNYGLYIGYDGKNLEEIKKAKNVAGVKVYVANSTGNMGVDNAALEKLFKEFDGRIVTHAEDEGIIEKNSKEFLAEFDGREVDPAVHSKIRSVEAAESAVKLVCKLAKNSKAKLHVAHVSCDAEIEVIAEYKKFGITCEVAPHHLLLSDDDYEIWKNFIKVNPPVRSRLDVFSMWKNLKFGVIDMIATDHAPHTIEEKEQSYEKAPSGVPELDTLLPIFLNTVNDEGMTIEELVGYLCEKPAQIFGIKNKGFLKDGFDADIVVVDMDLERKVERANLRTKCGWSPYEGSNFKGWPVMTFVGGELVFEAGKIVGKKAGKEVKFE